MHRRCCTYYQDEILFCKRIASFIYLKTVCERSQSSPADVCLDCFSCTEEEKTRMLMRCAGTSMSSKLIANHTEFFSKMVVDAVNTLDEQLPLDMIGIKKVQGEPYSFTPHSGEKIHATRNSR